MASLAIITKESGEIKIVSVGFGTKSLPYCFVSEHGDDLIDDMHAEILAIRGFKRMALKYTQVEGNFTPPYFTYNQKKNKHEFNKNLYEIWLYTSEIFCGDCFISQQ